MRTHDAHGPVFGDEPLPVVRGGLVLGGETAGCVKCGWRGVPTLIDGEASRLCPSCEIAPVTDQSLHTLKPRVREPRRRVAVSRNALCPCGSGVKAKKCGCDQYTV